jgi:hypothetical protein
MHSRYPAAGPGHDAVVRQRYHQLAPRTADGGRKILYSCPLCARTWLMNGRATSFALRTAETVRFYTRALALGQDPAPFPQAVCRPCSLAFGGRYGVEEYFQHDGPLSRSRGYRLRWEGVRSYPTDAYLACSVLTLGEAVEVNCDRRGLEELLGRVDLDVALSPHDCLEGVVDWLKHTRAPRFTLPYLARPEEAQWVAEATAPQEGLPAGVPLEWKGWDWFDWCPPLRDAVLVQVAVALPPGAAPPPETLLDLWRKVLAPCSGEELGLLLGLPARGALV